MQAVGEAVTQPVHGTPAMFVCVTIHEAAVDTCAHSTVQCLPGVLNYTWTPVMLTVSTLRGQLRLESLSADVNHQGLPFSSVLKGDVPS